MPDFLWTQGDTLPVLEVTMTDADGALVDLTGASAVFRLVNQATQAVSHILDLDELLGRILELIFRSIHADRGCIMLRHPDTGELEPKVLRCT